MSLLPLDESRRVDELSRRLFTSYPDDQRFDRYYEGSQRLAHTRLLLTRKVERLHPHTIRHRINHGPAPV